MSGLSVFNLRDDPTLHCEKKEWAVGRVMGRTGWSSQIMLFGRRPACGLRVSACSSLGCSGARAKRCLLQAGHLAGPTFSALPGMSAFLVLLQAADSQRSLFGSNSADHRLLPLCNRKQHRLLPNCHPVPQPFSRQISSTWAVDHAGWTDAENDVISCIKFVVQKSF